MNHLIFTNYQQDKSHKSIYFSMGCFWASEKLFWNIEGVVHTEVGYANPNIDNPSCGDAFRSDVTHREVVKVVYNPEITTLDNMLRVFWENHTVDFTKEQVPIIYRSGVFFENISDLEIANESMRKFDLLRKQAGKTKTITTELIQLDRYIRADDSHQQYVLKHKDVFCGLGFCGVHYT
jgi:peptide-methionine (S)-S-oxide reductase